MPFSNWRASGGLRAAHGTEARAPPRSRADHVARSEELAAEFPNADSAQAPDLVRESPVGHGSARSVLGRAGRGQAISQDVYCRAGLMGSK